MKSKAIRFTCKGEITLNFADLPTASAKLSQLAAIITMLRDLGMRGDFDTKLVTVDWEEPSRVGPDGVWLADPRPGGYPLPSRTGFLEDQGWKGAVQYSHEPMAGNAEAVTEP
jgi:hypothetical protein